MSEAYRLTEISMRTRHATVRPYPAPAWPQGISIIVRRSRIPAGWTLRGWRRRVSRGGAVHRPA